MRDRINIFKKLKKDALLSHIEQLKDSLEDAYVALDEMEEEGLTDEDAQLERLTWIKDQCPDEKDEG